MSLDTRGWRPVKYHRESWHVELTSSFGPLDSAPAIITQDNMLAPGPRTQSNLLAMITSFTHLTPCFWLYFSPSLSLFFHVHLRGNASSFVLRDWRRRRGRVIGPGWETIGSQLACRSLVMSKHDKVKVGCVCRVTRPRDQRRGKRNISKLNRTTVLLSCANWNQTVGPVTSGSGCVTSCMRPSVTGFYTNTRSSPVVGRLFAKRCLCDTETNFHPQ